MGVLLLETLQWELLGSLSLKEPRMSRCPLQLDPKILAGSWHSARGGTEHVFVV